MRPVLEEAVCFCWENYRKDYSPTADRRRFLHEYCAGRFITVALLDAAWEQCKQAERDATRSGLFNQIGNGTAETESPAESLERLDDASIDNLYHRTLREYAKSAKLSGVLV